MAKILVLDDEEMLLKVLRRALAGHELACFTEAQPAHDAIVAGARYDLIVCDLMMPKMTGMEFHAAVQKVVPDQAERMVFLTGGAFSRDAQEFLARVTNARVHKPFTVPALKALIADQLTARGGR